MRVLGADIGPVGEAKSPADGLLVLLDDAGRIERQHRYASLGDLARQVTEWTGNDPFLLGINASVVLSRKEGKPRIVDTLMRRRLGWKPPSASPWSGPTILAALASLDHPCLPWPDRDRRRSGLAEVHPGLALKSLLWEASPIAASVTHPNREAAFRAYAPLPYRMATSPARANWADRAASLDLTLRAIGPQDDFDLKPAWEALSGAASDEGVEFAGSLLDAALLAGTAKRYLDDPETCLFLGDRENGYTILPADGFLRRITRTEPGRPSRSSLFPRKSLRERLDGVAELRSKELLSLPGASTRVEAVFESQPKYEFDNVDEMVWWKHCRHLEGPALPEEGLQELVVRLRDRGGAGDPPGGLRLVRSRHRVLSFRFEPPLSWRARVATRDGKTYPFHVLRAVYETRD
jgi:predicted RNase H-like nuclease